MNFALYIARRYMLSKNSRNVVNIISWVALLGVVVGTTALVVVISIFNGFEDLIQSFYSYFDPEIKITLAEGKQFDPETSAFETIKNDPSVIHFCQVVEEIAHVKFEDRQYIARIKGVEDEFLDMSRLDQVMYDGDLMLNDGNFDYAVIGRGVAYHLGIAVNFVRPMHISVPKKGRGTAAMLNPFKQKHIHLAGIYAVDQQEVDDQFIIVPIDFARNLLSINKNVTSLELQLAQGTNIKRFQKKIQKTLGDQYIVQNRNQQHEDYYRVAKSERFFIFLTLSFIVIIASFNLASSIAMLLLDKKKDINILMSMGLNRQRVAKIFLYEGWLISTIGAIIGLTLGVAICFGQIHFGWLKFPGSFAVENYPVALRLTSLIIITVTVLTIGAFASWLPVKFLPKKFFQIGQD